MKFRVTTIAALFISTLLFFWPLSAIAANNDDLNQILNTSSCSGCDISEVTLSEINLSSANLSYANLTGTDLNQAILKDTDLSPYPVAQNSIALHEDKQHSKEQAAQEARDRLLAAVQAQDQRQANPVLEIKRSLASWSPISVKKAGGTATVVLSERRITDEIYKAAITYGLCSSVWAGDIDLDGVNEIRILNQFGAQGYVFEGGASACQELGKMPGDRAKWELLGKTHLYQNQRD